MKKKRLQRSDVFWLLAVALLILMQFWWLPGDPGTPDDSFSNTVSGKRGLFETLQVLAEEGLMPTVRRESMRLVPDDVDTLIIISPDRYPNEYEEEELASFVANGGAVLFTPNWTDPDCEIAVDTQSKESACYRCHWGTGLSVEGKWIQPGGNCPVDGPVGERD